MNWIWIIPSNIQLVEKKLKCGKRYQNNIRTNQPTNVVLEKSVKIRILIVRRDVNLCSLPGKFDIVVSVCCYLLIHQLLVNRVPRIPDSPHELLQIIIHCNLILILMIFINLSVSVHDMECHKDHTWTLFHLLSTS